MAPWLRLLETYMVQALLRTPAFHRVVEKVAKRVHQVRNGNFGKSPEDMGGTSIDKEGPGFLTHFIEEVQTQLGRAEQKQPTSLSSGQKTYTTGGKSRPSDSHPASSSEQEQSGRKGGFLSEFTDALREQVRGNGKPK